ncbi:hypothetical protein SAMN05192553_107151 [Cyclobacterium xiamenense]|uniref:Uncharacterized protein n=1 Tax=Cyclobacterium xiamenense TaxID=1297121 RepID=A0A1H7AKU9_9BACT|nr:hypothetical protein [Cyclobacterium xiamenense]SEJ66261.1 hypothetical protein SAMN05192553_107151 [Cyclobacterium xiamenense]
MNPKNPQNPFAKDPEAELARRLKYAQPLTREEFAKRLEEIRKKAKRSEND